VISQAFTHSDVAKDQTVEDMVLVVQKLIDKMCKV
jgi:hypothetical protein